MDQEKCQNKAHTYTKQYALSGISKNTFVTKGEIESNFLTTPTDKPKLNHWVKTILNQIVIQFEPFRRCIKKVTFYFIFFFGIKKGELNLLFLINIIWRKKEKVLSKTKTKFSLARHMWKEILFTISIQICFYLLFWPAKKGIHFKFQ